MSARGVGMDPGGSLPTAMGPTSRRASLSRPERFESLLPAAGMKESECNVGQRFASSWWTEFRSKPVIIPCPYGSGSPYSQPMKFTVQNHSLGRPGAGVNGTFVHACSAATEKHRRGPTRHPRRQPASDRTSWTAAFAARPVVQAESVWLRSHHTALTRQLPGFPRERSGSGLSLAAVTCALAIQNPSPPPRAIRRRSVGSLRDAPSHLGSAERTTKSFRLNEPFRPA